MSTESGKDTSETLTEEFLEKSEFILNNEVLFAIALTLNIYKSLSAPEISELLDLRKTTLFNYLNQLEEKNFIEMDEEKSHEEWKELGARARKYYRSTPLFERVLGLYNQENPGYEELLEMAKQLPTILAQPGGNEAMITSIIQSQVNTNRPLTNIVRALSAVNKTLVDITLAEIEKLIDQAKQGISEKELHEAVRKSIFSSRTAIGFSPFYIDMQTTEQQVEFQTAFRQFQVNLENMKKRFNKENAENSDKKNLETQYVFMFATPVKNNIQREETR